MQHPTISAIVPVRNEQPATLDNLCALNNQAGLIEVIVIDVSDDSSTINKLNQLQDQSASVRVVRAHTMGRSFQMNQGETHARGTILWFIHADTRVPQQAGQLILDSVSAARPWGRFDVQFNTTSMLMKMVAFTMNLRSGLTGICTGDQAIFVARDVFCQSGAFPEIAIMEDIALSRTLRRKAGPIRLRVPVVTSARRWESHGYLWTIFQMGLMRFLYWIGVSPKTLNKLYR